MHIGTPLITIPGIKESLKDMVENGAEIQGNASCYFNELSNAVENSASLTLVPNNSQEGNIKAMTPGVGSEDFTFQRNTTATRVNKDGLIESVDINVLRIDYTNGDCPEILIEPQRTNLVDYSEDLSQWNIGSQAEIQFRPNELNPKGQVGVWEITSGQRVNKNFTSVENKIYTFSFWLKSSDINKTIIISIRDVVNNNGLGGQNFNITTNWKKYYFSLQVPSTLSQIRVNARNTDNNYYVWGIQVEEGTTATSYIPTNGSIATRNADVVTLSNAQDLIGQEKGTIYIKFNAGNNFEINMLRFLKNVSGETEYILTYSPTEVKHYINGVLEQTDTGDYDWSNMDFIDLGNTNGEDILNGRIINFWISKEIIDI